MAWYNPATWTPVDAAQNYLGGIVGNAGSAAVGAPQTYKSPLDQVNSGSIGNYPIGDWTATTGTTSSANNTSEPWIPWRPEETGGQTTEQTAAQRAAAAQAAADAAGIADTTAYINDQIGQLERLLGSVGTKKQQGLTALEDNYKTSKQGGEQKYAQQFEDNTRSKMGAINQVDQDTLRNYNSLRRILGMSGSARQSAGKAGGQLIAREAGMARSKQLENAGMNDRNINNEQTSFLGNLLRDYNTRQSDINTNILSEEQDLTGKISNLVGQRASVNGGNYAAVRAAQAPYQATINDKQSQLDNLFNQYRTPFNNEAKLATLSQFNVDPTAVKASQTMGASDYSPYGQFIKKKFSQEGVA